MSYLSNITILKIEFSRHANIGPISKIKLIAKARWFFCAFVITPVFELVSVYGACIAGNVLLNISS